MQNFFRCIMTVCVDNYAGFPGGGEKRTDRNNCIQIIVAARFISAGAYKFLFFKKSSITVPRFGSPISCRS